MTTPDLNIVDFVPLKYKALVAAISGLLTLGVPYVLEVATSLPAPWPLVIGAVIGVLGVVGVYQAPAKPPGTVLVPSTPAVAQAAAQSVTPVVNPSTGSSYQNPWQ